jgi:hypothetical protein
MSNTKHTKGPWRVSCQFGGASEVKSFHTITDADNRLFVALADTKGTAHLIAAAPDLLEALEKVWQVMLTGEGSLAIQSENAKAVCFAIAKARGES